MLKYERTIIGLLWRQIYVVLHVYIIFRRILRRTIVIKIFIHVVLVQAKNIGQIYGGYSIILKRHYSKMLEYFPYQYKRVHVWPMKYLYIKSIMF